MKSRTFIPSVLIVLSTLVMTFLLVGCQSILTTRTGETESSIAADVCRAWQTITYSSRDTETTQTEIRAGNAARKAYCAPEGAP